MGKLAEKLAEAERHVVEAEARVTRQRCLVERLVAGRYRDAAANGELLRHMEAALAVLRLRRDRLRDWDRVAEPGPGQRALAA